MGNGADHLAEGAHSPLFLLYGLLGVVMVAALILGVYLLLTGLDRVMMRVARWWRERRGP